MRMLLTFVALLLASTASLAAEYTYSGGYYWSGGVAYNRTDNGYWYKSWYWVPGYYSYGCYVQGYWAYTWKWHSEYVYSPVKIDAEAPDIEDKIIALAKARDAAVFAAAAKKQKSESALALIDKLGLAGNFTVANYGNGLFPYGGYAGSAYSQQGSTVYGYSSTTFKQATDAYGQLDPNAPLQQAGLLTKAALEYAAQGMAGYQGIVKDINAGVAAQSAANGRANESLAKGQAIAAAAPALGKAVEAGASSRTETTVTQTNPVAVGSVPQSAAAAPKVGTAATASAAVTPAEQLAWMALPGPARCVKCHGANGKDVKSFDLTKYHPKTATPAEQERVRRYITAEDKDSRCPKDGPLTAAQALQFFVSP